MSKVYVVTGDERVIAVCSTPEKAAEIANLEKINQQFSGIMLPRFYVTSITVDAEPRFCETVKEYAEKEKLKSDIDHTTLYDWFINK